MQARTFNGRYRLDELIGEGGMAVVYRGYDLVLNRIVAIKVLRDQYATDTNFLRRFEREAQSAARLSHPRIANVYDVGQDGADRYIVMEYVHGPNLKELIRRQGPFTVDGAAFVIRQVAEALDYAHQHHLVHRDVKPQNILVDQNGNVKVVDFGIAKGLSDANLTEAGTGMGTVHYVSPEQARGEQATPASDIYATGIVLFEMLTKRLPFQADTPVGVAMQHVSADPPRPSDLNPAIPPEVDDIVLRALAKNPADRFRTATELANALDNWNRAPAASQATRAIAAGGAPPTAGAPRRRPAAAVGRGGRGAPPPSYGREDTFRDDIGCVTWLIGSAILIGLVGLVVLAFNLGDLSFFKPTDPTPPPTATTAAVVGTPVPSPSPAVGTATPSASPTRTVTPTPSPSPTPELVPVPALENSTIEQAQIAVQAGEFKLVTEEVYSNTVPARQIIDQDPPPEQMVPKGSEIHVTVSLGPEFITVPNVANQPRDVARRQLEAVGLDVTEVEEGSQTVPQGYVTRVEPSAQVRNGGTVTMYVSVGDKIQVPDVYQQPLESAVAKLEAAGLVVGSRNPQSCEVIQEQAPNFDCDSFPDGAVVSGTLQWNSWVPRGQRIDIAYYDADSE